MPFRSQERYEEAKAHFHECLQLQPDSIRALLNVAAAALPLRHFDEARRAAEEVLALEPHNVKALYR